MSYKDPVGPNNVASTAIPRRRGSIGHMNNSRNQVLDGRVRAKSVSVDDELELSVPEHKLRLNGSSVIGRKKANPMRKHLKPKTEVTDSESFIYLGIEALDTNDPNYDPSEHVEDGLVLIEVITPVHAQADQRKALEALISELFESEDIEDFLESVLEIDTTSQLRISAVVVAVEKALERNDECRDVVSRLLVELRMSHTVSDVQMISAFDTLLANVDDLTLDIPDTSQLLASFLGKAVADDVLHPGYIRDRMNIANPAGREVVRLASVRVSMPHGLVRLDSVWSGGACRRSVNQLMEQITIMLKEYLNSLDLHEAERQIRAWAVPHFHHEIVFEVTVMALEYGGMQGSEPEQRVGLLKKFLTTFTKSSLISEEQAQLGFTRVLKAINDLAVDLPSAKRDIVQLVQHGIKSGYLPQNYEQMTAAALGA